MEAYININIQGNARESIEAYHFFLKKVAKNIFLKKNKISKKVRLCSNVTYNLLCVFILSGGAAPVCEVKDRESKDRKGIRGYLVPFYSNFFCVLVYHFI